MKFFFTLTAVLSLLLLITLLPASHSKAAETVSYVDLDGDGFDDNATDDDLDGIPDRFASRGSQTIAPRAMLNLNKMFKAETNSRSASLGQTNHVLYTGRRTAVLSLATCRGGLGRFDRFGGDGTSQSSGGGACSGGVCR